MDGSTFAEEAALLDRGAVLTVDDVVSVSHGISTPLPFDPHSMGLPQAVMLPQSRVKQATAMMMFKKYLIMFLSDGKVQTRMVYVLLL